MARCRLSYEDVMLPTLRVLGDGHPRTPRATAEAAEKWCATPERAGVLGEDVPGLRDLKNITDCCHACQKAHAGRRTHALGGGRTLPLVVEHRRSTATSTSRLDPSMLSM